MQKSGRKQRDERPVRKSEKTHFRSSDRQNVNSETMYKVNQELKPVQVISIRLPLPQSIFTFCAFISPPSLSFAAVPIRSSHSSQTSRAQPPKANNEKGLFPIFSSLPFINPILTSSSLPLSTHSAHPISLTFSNPSSQHPLLQPHSPTTHHPRPSPPS